MPPDVHGVVTNAEEVIAKLLENGHDKKDRCTDE